MKAARRARRAWVRRSDEELMQLRLRDLDLRVEGSWLEGCVERLYEELEQREIPLRPHVWLSTEWFSPDGVPGIAIPFFLAHERLIKLERKQMLEVEGGSERGCMKLLRHEMGHVLDSAYRLHFKPSWRKTFGLYSQKYPDVYSPRPSSKSHVLHLGSWYAQAHPAEDFAETFAVWITPRSRWRQRYREWPKALRKLRYVDQLIEGSVAGRSPAVRSRRRVESIDSLSLTLGEYYEKKRERYGISNLDNYDRDLRRLFSADPEYRARPTAASFLRAMRREVREVVAEWTGAHTYTVDQVLQELIDRCREKKLRMALAESEAGTQLALLLTVHTMNCIHVGRQEIPL